MIFTYNRHLVGPNVCPILLGSIGTCFAVTVTSAVTWAFVQPGLDRPLTTAGRCITTCLPLSGCWAMRARFRSYARNNGCGKPPDTVCWNARSREYRVTRTALPSQAVHALHAFRLAFGQITLCTL